MADGKTSCNKKQTTYDSATTAIMPMMAIIKLATIIIIIIIVNVGNPTLSVVSDAGLMF